MAPKKGGPRRMPTPQVDMEHLLDVLKEQVRTLGQADAFQLGDYLVISKAQAISGKSLVEQSTFVHKLLGLNDSLLFNYKDLKDAFGEVCKNFPDLQNSFPVGMRPSLSGKLAEACMTMCTHVRRLKIDQKFQEACKSLSDWQVQKLEAMRLALGVEQQETKGSSRREEAAQGAKDEDSNSSIATQDLLSMDLPSTPGKKRKSKCLAEAEEVSPVPARKQNLRELQALKKPAARPFKRPAAKQKEQQDKLSFNYKKANLYLMTYKKTTAVAVVAKNVGQLLQVVKFKDVNKNKKAAERLMGMLQRGSTLATVLEAKNNL